MPTDIGPNVGLQNLAEGVGSLADQLFRARQFKAQQEQQRVENLRATEESKRKGQMDYMTALNYAQSAIKDGNMPLAAAIMAPYGGKVGEAGHDQADQPMPPSFMQQGPAPQAQPMPPADQQQSPPPAPQPQMTSQMSRAQTAANRFTDMLHQSLQDGGMPTQQPPAPVPPSVAASAPQAQQPPLPGAPPEAHAAHFTGRLPQAGMGDATMAPGGMPEAQSQNPLIAANEAGNRRRVLEINGPYGKMTIDPQEHEQEMRQRQDRQRTENQAVFDQFASRVGEDPSFQKYAPILSSLVVDKEPLSGAKLMEGWKYLHAKDADEEMRRLMMGQRLAINDYNQGQMNKRSAGRDAAISKGKGVMTPTGEDASLRGWNAQAETQFNNYWKQQEGTKNLAAARGYLSVLQDLESGNSAQMIGGVGKWVKEASGGSAVVTENEIKRYATEAIPWTAQAEKMFDYWAKGAEVPPEYVAPFTEALKKSIVARQRGIVNQIGLGAQSIFTADQNPEMAAYAKKAYLRATSGLLTSGQLRGFISRREKETEGGGRVPLGTTPKPGNVADSLRGKIEAASELKQIDAAIKTATPEQRALLEARRAQIQQ